MGAQVVECWGKADLVHGDLKLKNLAVDDAFDPVVLDVETVVQLSHRLDLCVLKVVIVTVRRFCDTICKRHELTCWDLCALQVRQLLAACSEGLPVH